MNEIIAQVKALINNNYITILAFSKICGCSCGSIHNYVNDLSVPTGTKLIMLQNGLKKYKELINNIIKE